MFEIDCKEKWGLDVSYEFDNTDDSEDIKTVLLKTFASFVSSQISY